MINLRNIINLCLLLTVALLQSACTDDPTPAFEGNMSVEFVVSNSDVNPLLTGTLTIPNVATFISQNAAANGVALEDIKSITPGRAVMSASFQNLDLSFLEEVSVQVVSKTGDSNVAEIFYLNNIPFNEDASTNLFGSLGELKDIMIEDIIDMQIVFDYRTVIPVDFIGEIQFTYLVFTE